jgi:hypothetical protein
MTSCAVPKLFDALLLGTMITAVKRAVLFESVSDYANPACRACRRKCVNCAFEAIEGVGAAIFQHLKRLIVVVAARFTFSHLGHSLFMRTKCQELLEELTRHA